MQKEAAARRELPGQTIVNNNYNYNYDYIIGFATELHKQISFVKYPSETGLIDRDRLRPPFPRCKVATSGLYGWGLGNITRVMRCRRDDWRRLGSHGWTCWMQLGNFHNLLDSLQQV